MSISIRNCTTGEARDPWRTLLLMVTVVMMFSGCGSIDNSDLHQRLSEIKARPAGAISGLPVFNPYETFSYGAKADQDPFQLFDSGAPITPPGPNPAGSPLAERGGNREALEEYPLDTLRYVGQLKTDGKGWAIVTSPDMIVHRVKVGNYLGQNFGKIVSIEESKILITETIPDEYSGWIKRDAALSLLE